MYLYFTGDENKAYYQSSAFGRVLTYMQTNAARCQLRDKQGKRSMVIEKVPTAATALETLRTMAALPPA